MNPDPLTIVPDDDEPEPDPYRMDREQARDVVLACVGLGVILAIVAYVYRVV